MNFFKSFLFLLIIVVAGCTDAGEPSTSPDSTDDNNGLKRGTFTADISGDSWEGTTVIAKQSGSVVIKASRPIDGTSRIQQFVISGAIDAPENYKLGAIARPYIEFQYSIINQQNASDVEVFFATVGTLYITGLNGNRIVGNFAGGFEDPYDSDNTLYIDGEFNVEFID